MLPAIIIQAHGPSDFLQARGDASFSLDAEKLKDDVLVEVAPPEIDAVAAGIDAEAGFLTWLLIEDDADFADADAQIGPAFLAVPFDVRGFGRRDEFKQFGTPLPGGEGDELSSRVTQPTAGSAATIRAAFKSKLHKIISNLSGVRVKEAFPARRTACVRAGNPCTGGCARQLGNVEGAVWDRRAGNAAAQSRTRGIQAACPATGRTRAISPRHTSSANEEPANLNGAVIWITLIAISRNIRIRAGLTIGTTACSVSPAPKPEQATPFRSGDPSEAKRVRQGWGHRPWRAQQDCREVSSAARAGACPYTMSRRTSFCGPSARQARQIGERQIGLRDLEQAFRVARRQGVRPSMRGHRDTVQPCRHVAAARVSVCTLHRIRPVAVPVNSDIPARRVGQL